MSDEQANPSARRRSGEVERLRELERPNEGPVLELIDAHTLGLPDEAALREHARRVCSQTDANHTCRSYSYPLALIATHTNRVGCDIERVAPCDEAFADSIRTPAERVAAGACRDDGGLDPMGRYPNPTGEMAATAELDRRITSLWSSKEALAKALGNALDYDPRRLQGPGSWPDGRSGPWRTREIELPDGYVGWVCWCVTES